MFRPFRRPEGDDSSGTSPAGEPTTPPPAPPAAASIALTPEQVRSSPEFRALERQLHAERTARGRSDAELERVRTEAEATRQAAEAQSANAQREQIRGILGDQGVADWEAIAELSVNDPVGAAQRFRDFGLRMAQSQPPATTAPAAPPSAPGGTTTVPPSQVPPLPPAGALGGNAPLGQPADDMGWDGIIADRTATFNEVVERVANPATRNRVTMRDRARGLIAYLEGSYAQAFKNQGRPNRSSR